MAKKRPAKAVSPKPPWLPDAALAVLLLLSTFLVYAPALEGGLLWDDTNHVTQPAMQSLRGLWRIWFDLGATAQYYPLLHSAFWLEHRIWGDSVLGYHLVNVTLHVASALLVVAIVRYLSLPGAWLAGFVFALHPVCVEAVAWISEQKSTLSGALCLASALAYLHFDRTRRRKTYLWALALFMLALLSKTTAAMLPVALLAILWWKKAGTGPARPPKPPGTPPLPPAPGSVVPASSSSGGIEWRRDMRPLIPWFAIAVPVGLFTAWVEKRYIGAQGAEFALTFPQRILIAGRALWFYVSKLIWPWNLTFSYPRWMVDAGAWWQWLFPAGVVVATAIFVWMARKRRGPLAALVIFSGMLFPALGFLNVYPFRYSFVADHFQYLASLGIIVPLAALAATAAKRIPALTLRAAAPVVLIAILGILSWRQTPMYSDSETLYRETLARNPDSFLAHNNLGFTVVTMPGHLPDAIAQYHEALRIEPDYPEAHFNLGAALILSRDPDVANQAIAEYRTAIRLRSDYAEAHNNLGNALARIPGRMDDATAEFHTALHLRPDMAAAHLGLGNVFAHTPGRIEDAVSEYQAALRLNPDYVEAHFNLGNALLEMPGREADAVTQYQMVLQLRPDLEPARQMLDQLEHR